VKTASDGTQQIVRGTESEEGEDFGGFTGHDTSAQIFRPVRGSFLPFSDGQDRVWVEDWRRLRSWQF
jgi:hypothetical protein